MASLLLSLAGRDRAAIRHDLPLSGILFEVYIHNNILK